MYKKIVSYVIASPDQRANIRSGRRIFCGLLAMTLMAGTCAAEQAIIKDVRGEIFDDSAKIVIEANCDINYLDYTLQDPHRLIIDPIGKIYSDLREVITFDSGPVKKVTVIKGRAEEELPGNFYPLDFISIELAVLPDYTIRKDIKEEIIVDITKRKEPEIPTVVEVPKETPKEIEEIEEVSEVVPLPEVKVERPAPQGPSAPSPPLSRGRGRGQALPSPLRGEGEVVPAEKVAPEIQEVIPLEEPAAPEPPEFIYKIGEGDNLDISVWQHPELDKQVIVRPDGFVSFPLVGDVRAAGFSPPEVASNIRENLSRLIKDPQVTVIVSGFGSKNIFVLGEVIKPGVYPFRGGINILEAISASGGWKNSAVLNSVMLVRKVFAEQPEAYRLNVYNIIRHGDFSQNLTLEPGDVVYVPKSFVANIGGFIENLKLSIGVYITETTKVFD